MSSEITEPVALDKTLQKTNFTLAEIRNVLMGDKKIGKVYGFHIDGGESVPGSNVTYIADAVGMTPAYMDFTNDVFVWGSWRDAWFIPRPCMLKYDGTVDYYLDPDDYTRKYEGGASDVANDAYAGNAMMEWGRDGKKIWYKIVPDSDTKSASVYIADHQADDGFMAWSFINNQGEFVDHFYTPIYNGWYDDTRIRSISGKTPTASQNAGTERTRCRANNASAAIWDTEVYCDNLLIILLLTLIGKSTSSQTVFGNGNTTGGQSGVLATGTMNDKGLFYGKSSSASTTSGVKVFGMENFWGNLWRRFGGLVNVSGTEKYKLTRGKQDGSTATDYVVSNTASDYDGYLVGGTLPSASGTYINMMMWFADHFCPVAASGSPAC